MNRSSWRFDRRSEFPPPGKTVGQSVPAVLRSPRVDGRHSLPTRLMSVTVSVGAMQASPFQLETPDGVSLFVYRWLPEQPTKAVVQIAHGWAEHAGRYARVAEALCRAGYAVYADDHRGHGRTAKTPADLGYFAENDGWNQCVEDLWRLHQ